MRCGFAVVLMWLAPIAAVAQEQDLKKEILHCATVDGSSNRLDCYDALADTLVEPSRPASPGQWTVKVGKNPLDDTTVVAIGLLGAQYQAELTLLCRQAKPEVLLGLRGQIIGASDPVVWTRFGGGKAEKKKWSVSADNKGVLFPGDARPFIRQLLGVDRLTVQLEHFLRGSVTDVFSVQGLKDVIAPLNDACNLR